MSRWSVRILFQACTERLTQVPRNDHAWVCRWVSWPVLRKTHTDGEPDSPWIDPTVELKDNLQKLAERIKALESALETFSATHPLLTKEQKSLKTKYLKRGAHNRKTSTDVAEKTEETPEETNRASSLIVREDGVTECIAEEQGWWRYVHVCSDLVRIPANNDTDSSFDRNLKPMSNRNSHHHLCWSRRHSRCPS